MKDYKLSEVQAICEQHSFYGEWCEGCPFAMDTDIGVVCKITGQNWQPTCWEIDEVQDDETRDN